MNAFVISCNYLRSFHRPIFHFSTNPVQKQAHQALQIRQFFLLEFELYALDIKLKLDGEIWQMMHKVFVYGTLKKNEPNHSWMQDKSRGIGNFLAKGKTKQKYPLIIATKYNIPFLLHSPGKGHHVQGEVYEVDDEKLSHLDELEDHPNFYVREQDEIEIEKEDKTETVHCWVYFLKKFKTNLLTLPTLENYSSNGDHGLPYTERSKRDPNYSTWVEVKT